MRSNNNPESLTATLLSLAKFVLIVSGIVGFGLRFFAKDGWLAQLLDDFTQGRISWSVATLALAIIAFFVIRDWVERTYAKKPSSALADWLTYGMMAAGAYFIFRLLSA